jgi:DNA adenine methylase
MKSIFRYPGGKSGLRAKIMSLAPARFAEYREPFVGGGWVFFAIPKGKRRWINDKDEGLMAVYRALRDEPATFIRECQQVKPLEIGEAKRRLKAVFDQFVQGGNVAPALRFLFLNRTALGGRVNYEMPSRMAFAHPEGWNIVTTDRLWQAAGLLCQVQITTGDYLPLLRAPGEGVWLYCDPPYFCNNRVARGARQYRHIFTREQHAQFAQHVGACSHNVLVSYDDDPFIRNLYSGSGFRISPIRVRYRMGDGRRRQGKELLISNYDPPRPRRAGLTVSLARL